MKKKTMAALALTFCTIAFQVSCKKEKKNEINISSFTEDESHNFGQNCMTCHVSGGEGKGWFTLAGSVSGQTPNATVELCTDTSLASSHTIEVDTKGNFYTTESIDFSQNFTVGIRKNDNSINHMPIGLTSGQCNSCHGNTSSDLTIN
jgi:hypothetical protein